MRSDLAAWETHRGHVVDIDSGPKVEPGVLAVRSCETMRSWVFEVSSICGFRGVDMRSRLIVVLQARMFFECFEHLVQSDEFECSSMSRRNRVQHTRRVRHAR